MFQTGLVRNRKVDVQYMPSFAIHLVLDLQSCQQQLRRTVGLLMMVQRHKIVGLMIVDSSVYHMTVVEVSSGNTSNPLTLVVVVDFHLVEVL